MHMDIPRSPEDLLCDRLCYNIALLSTDQSTPWSSPQNGVSVPQRVYERTPGRGPPSHFGQGLVLFLLTDGSCLPASLALDKKYKFTELIHRDDLALPDAAQTVTVRVEWTGYQPRDYQLRTIDWANPPKKIIVSKLATEVAKLIKKFIEDVRDTPITPEHAQWRVGPGHIQIEHLRLASFQQVTQGSWQVRLFYDRPT